MPPTSDFQLGNCGQIRSYLFETGEGGGGGGGGGGREACFRLFERLWLKLTAYFY